MFLDVKIFVIILEILCLIALGMWTRTLYKKVRLYTQPSKSRNKLVRNVLLDNGRWQPSLAGRAAWKLAFSLVSKSLKQQKYLRSKSDKDDADIERFVEGIVHEMVDKSLIMSCHGGRLRQAGVLAKCFDKRRAIRRFKALAESRRTMRKQRRNGQLAAPKEHIATACGMIRSVTEMGWSCPSQPAIGDAMLTRSASAGQSDAEQHLSLNQSCPGEEEQPSTIPGQLMEVTSRTGAGRQQKPLGDRKLRGVWYLRRNFGKDDAMSSATGSVCSSSGMFGFGQNPSGGQSGGVGSLVVCFGDGQRGQLGKEPSEAARLTSRNTILTVEELRGCQPVQVKASGMASFVVGYKGQVWGFGSNRYMELGMRKEIAQVQSPQRVKSVRDECAVQVASSVSASGQGHTVVLTATGDVYTCGSSSTGALGHGPEVRQTAPLLLRIGGEVKIQTVAAGARHTVLISDDGIVYTVGENRHGQLGRGTRDPTNCWFPKFCDVPQIVPGEFGQTRIKFVATGDDHNLAASDDGRLFAWGANSNGQLGIGRTGDQAEPVAVRDLQNLRISSMSCGLRHSIVVTDGRRRVWTFGSNVQGQLGIGEMATPDSTSLCLPTVCTTLSSQPNVDVVQVEAAACHSLAVLSTGEVYAWGDNAYGQLGFPKMGAGHPMSHAIRASWQAEQTMKQCRSRKALEVDAPKAFAEGMSRIYLPVRVVSLSLFKVKSISTSDMHTLALVA